jgi:protein O-GlcNAc transferase
MSSRHVLTRGKKQRAAALLQERRLAEAAKLYEDVCRTDPRDAQAWSTLAAIHGLLDQHTEVIRCGKRAIEIEPGDAIAHNNLSAAYLMLGRCGEAEASARRALEIVPNQANALVNLGNALCSLGRIDEAVATHESALRLNPGDADAQVGLGLARAAQGRFDSAIAHYNEALRLNPRLRSALVALGRTLKTLGQHDAAAAAFRQAIALKHDDGAAWNGLGITLLAQGAVTEAVDCFERVPRNSAEALAAQTNRARALSVQGCYEEAVASLREAIRLDPQPEAAWTSLLFALSYTPGVDPATVFKEHVAWGNTHARTPASPRDGISTDPERPLRVGYVSPDFREHSVRYFIEPILAHHDPAAVEVFCYANLAIPDTATERFRRTCRHWRDIFGKSDEQAVELIRRDGIDILVDLAGHTGDSRLLLFARKPAPVQVSYLGYPNTSGLPQIDYRLTDEWADPPGQEAFHTETLVRLSHGFLCYQPPSTAPAVEPPPVLRQGHVTFGSFNAPHKINQAVMDLWAAVLRETPGSRLVLKNRALRDTPTRERYLARLAEGGISADRVELIGWLDSSADHLALYHRIDIALDTFPYCGTTTTCEALWMGVPVVTLVGARHIERVGFSLLTQVGLPELAATDGNDYVRIAVELSGDAERLATLRYGLRERMRQSPLCDAEGFTRSLETAYRQMWRGWIARKPTGSGQDSGR